MSIFEHDNYDMHYQRYLDWKDEQEQLDREYEGYEEYEYDLLREQQVDEMRAAQYEEETTGERVVRAALSDIAEEEEDMRQLAQVMVNGVYRYEFVWLPETHEVRVEMENYRNGLPVYYWYPESNGVISTLATLMNTSEEKISVTGLMFFTPERVIDDLFDIERQQFMRATWLDYAADDMAMQFNVEIAEEKVCPNQCYDAACDGTNCEFNAPVANNPHGIDGTQCDCYDCERRVEERWIPEE